MKGVWLCLKKSNWLNWTTIRFKIANSWRAGLGITYLDFANIEEVLKLRRSSRIRRPTTPSDYVVYLKESDFNVRPKDNPSSFLQTKSGNNSTFWFNSIKEEMKFMAKN